jgi:predicted nucleotide-binding protein
MARSPPPPPPQRPRLTAEQKRQCIRRFSERIADLQAFDPTTLPVRYPNANVTALETSIDRALAAAFGNNTVDYMRYETATRLDNGPHTIQMGGTFGRPHYDNPREWQGYYEQGKQQALVLLGQAVQQLEEELEDEAGSAPVTAATAPRPARSRRIFVVHGRDPHPKEAVARFLAQLGFTPVILNEQPNQGMTVIEKIEAHSDVGFAVVLLTPDDGGNLKGEQPKPRARQNVLLELGYFIAKLQRKNVCPLVVGEVEIPSDWQGVINETFDAGGAWRFMLARELRAAGYEVDLNAVDDAINGRTG